MMKHFFILALMLCSQSATAQKVAYIYSEKVFKSIPEYNKVVSQLERYMESSSKEAKEMLQQVEAMYNEYRQREQYMSNSSKESARKMIIVKEKEANNYVEKSMERKQKELMTPLENRVTEAINLVSQEQGVDLMLDLSVAKVAIYTNKKLDYTQLVISKLKN